MAAITVLQNPLDEKELYQFSVTPQFFLGLDKWTSQSVSTSSSASTTQVTGIKGPIWTPSSIAALVNENEIKVFGLVERTDSTTNPTSTSVGVAQISPAISSLVDWGADFTFGRNLAVASDSNGNATLFYIGVKGDEPELKSAVISGKSAASMTANDDTPDANTFLSAYCVSNNHLIVTYQLKKYGHIREYNTYTKDNLTVTNSAEIKVRTPLAVCFANGKVYLYFANSSNTLLRCVKTGDTWSGHQVVGGENSSHTLSTDSQLSVVVDKYSGATSNSIFFVADGDTKYTRFTDNWS